MHLTKRQEALFRGNAGVNKIAQAIATINALSPTAWYHMRGSGVPTSSGGFASMWPDMADTDNGLVLPGVSGNRASTPASEVFRPSNTVSMRARIKLVDWTPSTGQTICGQYSGGVPAQDGPFFYVNPTTGRLGYVAANDSGTQFVANSSVAPTVSDGDALWVRVDHDRTANEVKFYTAPDSADVPSSWTQLGTTQAPGAMTEFNAGATQLFQIGASGTGGVGSLTNGSIYRVIDIVDGVTVFDADFSAQAKGTTSFTESSSNAATVTVNQSGALPAHIGNAKDFLQGTATNQPAYSAGVITFDGVDNLLASSNFSLAQPTVVFAVCSHVSWTLNEFILDGLTAFSGAIYQATTSPEVSASAGDGLTRTGPAVGSFGIVAAKFNGASSSLQVNGNSAVTGNAGAGNMGGVTVGARGGGGVGWGNVAFKELVIIDADLSATEISNVISALNTLNTVF